MLIESRYAFFGGKVCPIEEAKISILAAVVNYGLGVFEGIRAYWVAEREEWLVFRLEDHLERLRRNGRILLMDSPITPSVAADAVAELLIREGIRGDAYIRPLLFQSSPEIGPHVHNAPCELSMFVTPLSRYVNTSDGIRAVVSSWRRVSDVAIPPRGKISGSYVNAALAKSEAVFAGADDAILLSQDGAVSEATVSNLFLVRSERLITPPVTAGILEGITRESILALAEDLGMTVIERAVERSELYVADEVFLCGTATEVAPVIEIDRRRIGEGAPGPVTRRLSQAFDDAVHGRSRRHTDWCTPVSPGGKART
jgi:branched-chain amino acid aminotransferase